MSAMARQEFKNLLNPQQVREIKDKIAGYERFLKEHKLSEFKMVRQADETFARQELARYRKLLAERTPKELSGTERGKLYQRAKYLERKIQENMPTKDEMMGKRGYRSDNPNKAYQEAIPSVVNIHMRWQEANASRIKEWKFIMRTLEPNDPNATNIENLRRIH